MIISCLGKCDKKISFAENITDSLHQINCGIKVECIKMQGVSPVRHLSALNSSWYLINRLLETFFMIMIDDRCAPFFAQQHHEDILLGRDLGSSSCCLAIGRLNRCAERSARWVFTRMEPSWRPRWYDCGRRKRVTAWNCAQVTDCNLMDGALKGQFRPVAWILNLQQLQRRRIRGMAFGFDIELFLRLLWVLCRSKCWFRIKKICHSFCQMSSDEIRASTCKL